jgi:hypothetical protein
MQSLTRVFAVSLVVALATPTLAAQTHPLAGRWEMDYERGHRSEDGVLTSIRGKATLTLELRGDSLVGTFEPAAQPDMPKPATQRFAAKPTARGAVFVVRSEIKLNMNGEIETREAVTTWTLEATGDTLEGTTLRTFTGMEMAVEPVPVKGTRVK